MRRKMLDLFCWIVAIAFVLAFLLIDTTKLDQLFGG